MLRDFVATSSLCLVLSFNALPALGAGSITQVASRAALAGTDFIGWSQLPGLYQILPNSITVSSQNGLSVQVMNTGAGNIHSEHQDDPWGGNFAPGDFLLYADNSFEVTFPQPVSAVGTQLGYDCCGVIGLPGQSFVGHMVLFDSSHNVLASLTVAGFEQFTSDNSAVFIGAIDSIAEIKSVQFFNDGSAGVAINELSFSSCPMPTGEQFQVPTTGFGSLMPGAEMSGWDSVMNALGTLTGYDFAEQLVGGDFRGIMVKETLSSPPSDCPIPAPPAQPAMWTIDSNNMFVDQLLYLIDGFTSDGNEVGIFPNQDRLPSTPGAHCSSVSYQQMWIYCDATSDYVPYGPVNQLEFTIYKDQVSFSRAGVGATRRCSRAVACMSGR